MNESTKPNASHESAAGPAPQTPEQAAVSPAMPRIHRHTLVEMNRPAFMARYEVAHRRVGELLSDQVFHCDRDQRVKLYTGALRLLEDAVTAAQRSQVQKDTPLLHYLGLLRDTVSASLALVRHEVRLLQEAPEFSRLMGEELASHFKGASDAFSQSEMNGLDGLRDLLQFGEALLASLHDGAVAAFTDDDHRRYELAAEQYAEFYTDATS